MAGRMASAACYVKGVFMLRRTMPQTNDTVDISRVSTSCTCCWLRTEIVVVIKCEIGTVRLIHCKRALLVNNNDIVIHCQQSWLFVSVKSLWQS